MDYLETPSSRPCRYAVNMHRTIHQYNPDTTILYINRMFSYCKGTRSDHNITHALLLSRIFVVYVAAIRRFTCENINVRIFDPDMYVRHIKLFT